MDASTEKAKERTSPRNETPRQQWTELEQTSVNTKLPPCSYRSYSGPLPVRHSTLFFNSPNKGSACECGELYSLTKVVLSQWHNAYFFPDQKTPIEARWMSGITLACHDHTLPTTIDVLVWRPSATQVRRRRLPGAESTCAR